jgi:glycosyltransferase involved in cell wall biosynthesis
MVPPANPEALAEALNLALDLTPEQRTMLASRAISHVHAHFSMDQMCWATLDTYAELCNCPLPWALPESAA